jgi:hypothetical protein
MIKFTLNASKNIEPGLVSGNISASKDIISIISGRVFLACRCTPKTPAYHD